MTKEKLIEQIMREAEKDGEPVTKEEATEMAEMEIRANADRRYEKSDTPRKKAVREHKVDETKVTLLAIMRESLEKNSITIESCKPETEFTFSYKENEYTVKLIKHRPKKGE